MRRFCVGSIACLLLVGGISGCGRGGGPGAPSDSGRGRGGGPGAPSDGDIDGAIKDYFRSQSQFRTDLHLRLTEGKYEVRDVRVMKRGEYYRNPGDPDQEGYPVRVMVKGSVTTQVGGDKVGEASEVVEKPFEVEKEFVMRYSPPDKSKVEPGPGRWVAGH